MDEEELTPSRVRQRREISEPTRRRGWRGKGRLVSVGRNFRLILSLAIPLPPRPRPPHWCTSRKLISFNLAGVRPDQHSRWTSFARLKTKLISIPFPYSIYRPRASALRHPLPKQLQLHASDYVYIIHRRTRLDYNGGRLLVRRNHRTRRNGENYNRLTHELIIPRQKDPQTLFPPPHYFNKSWYHFIKIYSNVSIFS